ncbi:hypothetical protein KUTeg_012754 [Tegillarca granosa]|uniref:ATP synthase F0 subunit 8 n=1 Tax=Tegillarca granosa TaxID=220873 RepID=A0ABQ9F0N3_TEGGR|nr:hypothetical protein KUTeg_012754 [Tegillarca granosa]
MFFFFKYIWLLLFIYSIFVLRKIIVSLMVFVYIMELTERNSIRVRMDSDKTDAAVKTSICKSELN